MPWLGRSGNGASPHRATSLPFKILAKGLLIFAAVMLDLMEGVFELSGFKRIELGFGFADVTDQCLEVGRLGVALNKSGKSEFLDWHRVPPGASIAKVQSSVRNSWNKLQRAVESVRDEPCGSTWKRSPRSR
jgi:hypothetical protein